jgi:Tol biopolymer transport system component
VSQQLSVDLGADAFLERISRGMPQLAISPDGSMLAFVGERDRVEGLYLRRFAQLQALPLVTGPVSDPFFSPDGEWVGFFSIADRKLKKIPVAGGSAVAICDIDTFILAAPRGAMMVSSCSTRTRRRGRPCCACQLPVASRSPFPH